MQSGLLFVYNLVNLYSNFLCSTGLILYLLLSLWLFIKGSHSGYVYLYGCDCCVRVYRNCVRQHPSSRWNLSLCYLKRNLICKWTKQNMSWSRTRFNCQQTVTLRTLIRNIRSAFVHQCVCVLVVRNVVYFPIGLLFDELKSWCKQIFSDNFSVLFVLLCKPICGNGVHFLYCCLSVRLDGWLIVVCTTGYSLSTDWASLSAMKILICLSLIFYFYEICLLMAMYTFLF